ncbi:FAD dependent oxidoreductase [Coniochaeta ligniaria NRRL 30616]|uniref:FAD dependent oxidoreductase n=1 Tax=Coniochaeta ligniaria NRRL 30616 TaxID=1408157 RepID=A0A1J7ICG8_9PEZI|nr:FAD dependent oxidoreductase [Coniochaeta ligniaria NRRL 30616]
MDASSSSSLHSNPNSDQEAFTSSSFLNSSTTSTSTSTPSSSDFSPPSSILIIGSGVFGLSTAYALTSRHVFSNTSITVVDRASAPSTDTSSPPTPVFPARDASSIDTSRIIRGDYADPAYAALATSALRAWRKADSPDALGAQGRYSESGLVLVADDGDGPETLEKLTSPSSAAADVGASLLEQHNAKKTGLDYVRASWENAVALGAQDPELASRIRLLPDADAIREAVGTGGSSGSRGYINGYAGWADAEKSMAWLYERVRRTGRVTFVSGTVASLEHADDTVTGAKLDDGRTLSADLVILATGAWTASLLDLSGQATATGQVVAYMDITPQEQSQLSKMPVLLNLTTGLFIIPPSNNVLKVARHAYGYLNPVPATTTPLSPSSSPATPQKTISSYPRTNLTTPQAHTIPAEGLAALRSALRQMLPSHPQLHARPFSATRLCWYTDTPTGDFIITYHPHFRGLFVATGGSGHGFKFLPVLGEKIVDAVEGRTPGEFVDKWAWKEGRGGGGEVVATEDGSRGGTPGLVLEEELGRRVD